MPTEITAFTRIQKGVDKLISKHGTESAADLIEAITLEKNHQSYIHSVSLRELIIKEVVTAFKINHKLLPTGLSSHYKEARKCCFYLLNKHCKMSQVNIKKQFPKFPKTTGSINGCIIKMREVVDFPKINKPLFEKYTTIEQKIIKFKTEN